MKDEITRDLLHLRMGERYTFVRIADVRAPGLLELVAESGQLPPRAGTPMQLGWVTRTGINWHNGVVTATEPSTADAFVARVEQHPVRIERRRAPRARARLPITVETMNGEAIAAELEDVSEGGIRVRTDSPLALGDVVVATISIGFGETVQFTARVHRHAVGSVVLCYEIFSRGRREQLVQAAFTAAARVP